MASVAAFCDCALLGHSGAALTLPVVVSRITCGAKWGRHGPGTISVEAQYSNAACVAEDESLTSQQTGATNASDIVSKARGLA